MSILDLRANVTNSSGTSLSSRHRDTVLLTVCYISFNFIESLIKNAPKSKKRNDYISWKNMSILDLCANVTSSSGTSLSSRRRDAVLWMVWTKLWAELQEDLSAHKLCTMAHLIKTIQKLWKKTCLSDFDNYRIVASTSPSRIEAHAGLFRSLMKGIFDPYVLWPFDKKLIF